MDSPTVRARVTLLWLGVSAEQLGPLPEDKRLGDDAWPEEQAALWAARWVAAGEIAEQVLALPPQMLLLGDLARPRIASQAGAALEIVALSRARQPSNLLNQAIAFDRLLDEMAGDRQGLVIDTMSALCTSFEVRRQQLVNGSGVDRLIAFHAVAEPAGLSLHSHGLAKLGCPDLECDSSHGDPVFTRQTLLELAAQMVEPGCLTPGQILDCPQQGVRIRVISHHQRDHGPVVRIELLNRANGKTQVPGRAEYFHGS